ncbi:unnamed protein product [Musa banksii]
MEIMSLLMLMMMKMSCLMTMGRNMRTPIPIMARKIWVETNRMEKERRTSRVKDHEDGDDDVAGEDKEEDEEDGVEEDREDKDKRGRGASTSKEKEVRHGFSCSLFCSFKIRADFKHSH